MNTGQIPKVIMSLQATEQPRKPPQAEPKQRITAKVRAAIEAMVWDGLPRDEAAAKAGISPHGLYKAFRSPPVKTAYLAELEVLRTSERARNIHTLLEVRNQQSNQMARVNAIGMLERIGDQEDSAGPHRASPGLIIVIEAGAPERIVGTSVGISPKTIDHE